MIRILRATSLALAGLATFALASSSASAQVSLDLIGDKDCFGTGMVCVEGATVPGGFTAVTADPGDPAGFDDWTTGGSGSWTHTFTPVTSAFLQISTAGIADIAGPYDVFVDGILVGSIPFDGGVGNVFVETYTFGLSSAILADGMAMVSFDVSPADGWAVDYSEILSSDVVASPEPGTVALLLSGLLGLAVVARRRREGRVL